MTNSNKKSIGIALSAGQDLLISIKPVGQFQIIIVPNDILSGSFHLYHGDTHIADIVFEQYKKIVSPKMTVKRKLVSASGDGEEIKATAAWY